MPHPLATLRLYVFDVPGLAVRGVHLLKGLAARLVPLYVATAGDQAVARSGKLAYGIKLLFRTVERVAERQA